MRLSDRAALRERFAFCCGYCGISETDTGAELTADHFQPRSRGGSDDAANLVYCCHACNEFKGDFWQSDSMSARRLLHPGQDAITDHIASDGGGTLRGLTDTGRFHIRRLHLNRPALIAHRQRRRRDQSIEHNLAQALNRLSQLEQQVQQLAEQLGPEER